MIIMSQSRGRKNENQVSSVSETIDMLEKKPQKHRVMRSLNPASNTNEF